MEFLAKSLFFFALFASTYGRYIWQERNVSEVANNCSCDWKYFKHYEIKGCVAEMVDSCGCPRKFSCPSYNQTRSAEVCVHHRKEYKVGSKIITSNPCLVCRCQGGVPPQISCISKDCPPMTVVMDKDCHPVYKGNKCCPHEFKCLDHELPDNDAETARIKTCEYNGLLYPFESRIYPEDDPCQVCVCDENWTSDNLRSCYKQDCIVERSRLKLETGCIPVYHERLCCPIEFYCPSVHNMSYSELANNESYEDHNATDDNYCYFANQFYGLREELHIGNPCVKCTCTVPPDFTCVHQTCPPSPSEDFCNRSYIPGECCASYECMSADSTEPKDGCPTPVCAHSSCHIEVPEGHKCPTCVCSNRMSELEHNNVEQVQQISQNTHQIEEPMQQVFQTVENGDDFSKESLLMMPPRIQDSEEQFPLLEKIILPEMEPFGKEEFQEFEEHLNDDFSYTFKDTSEEGGEHLKIMSDKVVQKRSEVSPKVPVKQEGMSQENEDIEREGVDFEDDHFDDELKKIFFDKNGTIINEIFAINHTLRVPPGCPTPLCEGSWCKIGIPEDHHCPTCICKRHTDNEP